MNSVENKVLLQFQPERSLCIIVFKEVILLVPLLPSSSLPPPAFSFLIGLH